MTEWKIGDCGSITRTITQEDILLFAALSGDDQPLHTNPEYAKCTRFGGIVAHGMLTGAIFSAVLGTKVPGEGAILLGMDLKFLKPVRPGDVITCSAQVENIGEKGRMDVRLRATNALGEEVANALSKLIYRQ